MNGFDEIHIQDVKYQSFDMFDFEIKVTNWKNVLFNWDIIARLYVYFDAVKLVVAR